MAAQFTDTDERIDITDDEELGNVDQIGASADESNLPTEDNTESVIDDDLPAKYRGKTARELVQMHQQAEKLIGATGSEVGELRKVVDQYISTQFQAQTPSTKAVQEDNSDDEYDFFTDPNKAVSRAIDNHPKIKQAEEVNNQYRKAAAMSTLQQQHPDMAQIVQDPKFGDWITASKIRTQLFTQADQQYDLDAANELFSLWKERQGTVQATVDAEKQARKQTVKAANTGSVRGSGESAGKKVYRRADIIKLMQNDPDRYAALGDEIMQAYADGRVR